METLSFTITTKDIAEFKECIRNLVWKQTGARWKIGLMVVVLMGMQSLDDAFRLSFVAALAAFSVWVGIFANMAMSFQRLDGYVAVAWTNAHGLLCGQYVVEYGESTIVERTPSCEIRRAWDQVMSLEVGARHIGLIMRTAPCVWIPHDAFASPDALAQFLELVRTRLSECSTARPPDRNRAWWHNISQRHGVPIWHMLPTHVLHGIVYVWRAHFWIIPTILSILGIILYHIATY